MIIYFSGTGNTRYLAEGLSKLCDDELISLTDLMKNGSPKTFTSKKPYIFIAPIYAWRIPKQVNEYLRKCTFNGNRNAYFIVTCGSSPGNAIKYIKNTMNKVNLNLIGYDAIDMPANYMAMYNVTMGPESVNMINEGVKQLKTIAEKINENKPLNGRKTHLLGLIQSSIVNPLFNAYISAKGFYTTENCNACGKCVIRCPLNNILLKDEKPVWGKDCMHCMACIGGCPQEAIEFKNKTLGQERYYLTKHFE